MLISGSLSWKIFMIGYSSKGTCPSTCASSIGLETVLHFRVCLARLTTRSVGRTLCSIHLVVCEFSFLVSSSERLLSEGMMMAAV